MSDERMQAFAKAFDRMQEHANEAERLWEQVTALDVRAETHMLPTSDWKTRKDSLERLPQETALAGMWAAVAQAAKP